MCLKRDVMLRGGIYAILLVASMLVLWHTLDEETIQKSAGFWKTRDRIQSVIKKITQIGALDGVLAAE